MNGVMIMFTQHEPNQAFMGGGREFYLHAKSFIYKYKRTVNNYQDEMALQC